VPIHGYQLSECCYNPQAVENLQRTFKFASILGGSEEIMADLGVRQAMMSWPADAKL